MFRGLSRKLIIIMCLFSVALSAAIGFIGYRTYLDSVLRRYQDFVFSIFSLAYRYIDADDMVECLATGVKSERYENTQLSFNLIKETTSITYLYFFTPREDKMVYYIYAFTQDEISDLGENEYLVTLADEDNLPAEIHEMLGNLENEVWIIPNVSDYGYMMGAYYAVKDSTGEVIGILAAEINMLDINITLRTYVITILVGALIIMAIFTLLAILYFRSNITVPIRELSVNASNFVSKNPNEKLEPIISSIKTNDEIEILGDSIEKMTKDMITYIENLTAVTAEKERIGAELTVATQIQASMLPCIFPPFPQYESFEIFASMQPAKEVGGDFYDFFLVDENTLAFVMADVSGKGVPAALFMVISKTLIKNNAQRGLPPKQVFEMVNNMLCENNETSMFVTAFMGYLDINSGKLTFVNAGHDAPLIRRDGKFDWLETEYALMLAGMDDTEYTEGEVMLKPGDELFLYTDGVTEAMDVDDNLFGNDRLLESVNKYRSDVLEDFTSEVKRDIAEFAGEAPQSDDITMLILKYSGLQ
ncbi:MAG: SpoIIE family protein phosphatase [Oscillospiraceae bacterium]|nr:SpoIIE family protein phosphatase [Oscillospiraceae bacterium]